MTDSVQKAYDTQVKNVQLRTGKSLDELFELIKTSELKKHGQIREMLIESLSIGYGDANMLAAIYLAQTTPGEEETTGKESLSEADRLYAGSKKDLQPVHEQLMKELSKLGEFEIAPKKTYLSLRCKRQFATLGPGTRGRIELGLNMKDVEGTDRLLAQAPGGMCQYKVYLTSIEEIDKELLSWVKTAYDSAG